MTTVTLGTRSRRVTSKRDLDLAAARLLELTRSKP